MLTVFPFLKKWGGLYGNRDHRHNGVVRLFYYEPEATLANLQAMEVPDQHLKQAGPPLLQVPAVLRVLPRIWTRGRQRIAINGTSRGRARCFLAGVHRKWMLPSL